ncbi:hypothetical protein CMI47_10250 [Candidatus Pacearchaeota archaeon]|jgi:predicted nucleic-acid-binding Zn-ribbon protein|nr:hypothetical protein [Candidatus Pacearchaeota archaeon]|tara:strand:- start:14116 stop:14469 length:354 start_codon:yes stop_codon:yes gene_type:complete
MKTIPDDQAVDEINTAIAEMDLDGLAQTYTMIVETPTTVVVHAGGQSEPHRNGVMGGYDGVHCPNCGSEGIEAGKMEAHGADQAFMNITCQDCDAEWTEDYKLSGISEVVNADGEPV